MAAFVPSAQQQRIIGAPQDDDVLVVAGAGSGKTFTMTQRIIHLIETGVAPEGILGLTFTRKAAAELLARVSAAVSAHAGARSAFMKPDVSTYDAFFQSIVRQYGLLVGFDQETQPLSAAGAVQLVSEVIGAHMGIVLDSGEDFGGFTSLVGPVLQLSSGIANAMIGGGCGDIDTAIAHIPAWDSRFTARPAAVQRAGGSYSIRMLHASWSVTVSPRSTSTAWLPARYSGIPPLRVASTGRPQAIASTATRPAASSTSVGTQHRSARR